MKPVLICGLLCNNDLALAELLLRHHIKVIIARPENTIVNDFSHLAGEIKYLTPEHLSPIRNSRDFIKLCYQSALILSISGGVNNYKSIWYDWLQYTSIMPPIINLTTGSDITELAKENTLAGIRYRMLLRNICHNYISPYPEAIKTIKKIKLNNYSIMRCPYYLLGSKKSNEAPPRVNAPITYLHASNLDWGVVDKKTMRNSTKGNDRFLKAFIKAVKNGENIHCILLDRGPDKEIAKKLIYESGCNHAFTILPPASAAELKNLIETADIVVDQFDVGAPGGIAFESMAQAKPVMLYIDKNCLPLVYNDEPSILNCYTEEEIYNTILTCQDRQTLHELGSRAENWVRKYHDIHTADFSEFILRVSLAAKIQYPRTDNLSVY